MTLRQKVAAELAGTGFLLTAVVGSGIMGERLAAGNAAVALLANSLATGAALVVLILVFGPISGAHFNPVVSLAAATRGAMPWHEAAAYIAAQLGGAFPGPGAATLRGSSATPALSGQRATRARPARSRAATSGWTGCSASRPTPR